MKILFVISSLEAGGAERVLTQLATHWADDKGHEVHIVIFRPQGTDSFYPLSSKVKLHTLGDLKRNGASFLSWGKRFMSSLWGLRLFIKKLNPDHVVSFVNVINIVTLLTTLGLKKPLIISERVDPRYHNITLLGNFLRRILYPLATKLIVQGDYIASYFPYLKGRVFIIPNPVSVPSSISSKKETKRLIHVGRLTPQKGQDILLKAFAKALKSAPNWHLDLYGQGAEKENLESLTKELGLQNNVTFQGVTKNIQEKVSEASVFCFPSRFEGFPNALSEAMALGLPVVASDCGGNLELVQHEENGLICPIDDVDAFAKALARLMTQPDYGEKLGNQAKKSMKKFSKKTAFEKWDEVISRV
ncbi:MAG TPA: hypothetical protein DD412_01320 [Holosporales bacterium]|nr:hypothetical protein [Holosporales bacterium]